MLPDHRDDGSRRARDDRGAGSHSRDYGRGNSNPRGDRSHGRSDDRRRGDHRGWDGTDDRRRDHHQARRYQSRSRSPQRQQRPRTPTSPQYSPQSPSPSPTHGAPHASAAPGAKPDVYMRPAEPDGSAWDAFFGAVMGGSTRGSCQCPLNTTVLPRIRDLITKAGLLDKCDEQLEMCEEIRVGQKYCKGKQMKPFKNCHELLQHAQKIARNQYKPDCDDDDEDDNDPAVTAGRMHHELVSWLGRRGVRAPSSGASSEIKPMEVDLIPWPPLIYVRNLPLDHDSQKKLKQWMGNYGENFEAFAIYTPRFKGEAVFKVASGSGDDGDHSAGFQKCEALVNGRQGSQIIKYVTESQWDDWVEKEPVWAKKLLKTRLEWKNGATVLDEMERARKKREAAKAREMTHRGMTEIMLSDRRDHMVWSPRSHGIVAARRRRRLRSCGLSSRASKSRTTPRRSSCS